MHVPDEVRERWYQHLEDEFDLCHAGLEAVISSAYAELAPLLASRLFVCLFTTLSEA